MAVETYKTFEAAEDQCKRMRETGWPDARPIQSYMPDHPDADSDGNVWNICAEGGEGNAKYVQDDGYVR